jgi:hypothetical protein
MVHNSLLSWWFPKFLYCFIYLYVFSCFSKYDIGKHCNCRSGIMGLRKFCIFFFLFLCPPRSKIVGHIVFVLSVIICPSLFLLSIKNVNLGYNFLLVGTIGLWHFTWQFLNCDTTFPKEPKILTLWLWPNYWKL